MADRLLETHCSTLLFLDDLVYKRKKPLDLGFADFRSPEARRAACEAEVTLNRRLAPDVYLGVDTVLDPDGAPCDWLVVMRRLPDEQRLGALVLAGQDVLPALVQVARDVAGLHVRSPAPARLAHLGRPEHLTSLWTTGLDALTAFPSLVSPEVRERTRFLAHRYVTGRGPLLARRVDGGHLVDGHGDLLADDVFVLPDGPRVLDCLEFDERLRVGDSLADAAFLAMDLERLGRPDLGRAFLDAYRAATSDDSPRSLERHYIAYRAHVRSKVACLRAGQSGAAEDARQAGGLAALALAHLEQARIRLVVVGGLPGSGKTTLARGLAPTLDAQVLSSDVVRKELHGLPPTASAAVELGAGIYSAAATEDTYGELLARAEQALGQGVSVVLDATFTDGRHRADARRLADRTSADLTELRCVLGEAQAAARLDQRSGDASDATTAVRAALASSDQPWPEAVEVSTTGPVEAVVAQALRALG